MLRSPLQFWGRLQTTAWVLQAVASFLWGPSASPDPAISSGIEANVLPGCRSHIIIETGLKGLRNLGLDKAELFRNACCSPGGAKLSPA